MVGIIEQQQQEAVEMEDLREKEELRNKISMMKQAIAAFNNHSSSGD